MTDKPKLKVKQANRLISEVNTSDRRAARLAIAKGVETAQNQWIHAEFIADALAEELLRVAENNLTHQRAAAYLRELATLVEHQVNVH